MPWLRDPQQPQPTRGIRKRAILSRLGVTQEILELEAKAREKGYLRRLLFENGLSNLIESLNALLQRERKTPAVISEREEMRQKLTPV